MIVIPEVTYYLLILVSNTLVITGQVVLPFSQRWSAKSEDTEHKPKPLVPGIDHVERLWLNRLKNKDYVEQSEVANHQNDWRYCRKNVEDFSTKAGKVRDFHYYGFEYCIPKKEKYKDLVYKKVSDEIEMRCKIHSLDKKWRERWFEGGFRENLNINWITIWLPHRLRITGIRELTLYQYQKVDKTGKRSTIPPMDYKTHISIFYKLYTTDSFEGFYENNGEVKVFRMTEFDMGNDDEAYGTLTLDHDIVAKYVYIDLKYWRGVTSARLKFQLLGCHDDIGMKNFQSSPVTEDEYQVLSSTPDFKTCWHTRCHPFAKQEKFGTESSFQKKYISAIRKWNRLLQPDYEAGCAIFDFETGKLSSEWTTEGRAFTNQPTHGDTQFRLSRSSLTGFRGEWWVSSYDQHPNPMSVVSFTSKVRTGTLTSPIFTIRTPKLSFLLGGGDKSGKIGVEIVIFKQTVAKKYLSREHKKMMRYVLNVDEFLTKPARVRLVDESTTGYLMFDDLRTFERCGSNIEEPLGMESGFIPDEYLTSSAGNDPGFPPKNARFSSTFESTKYFKIPMPPFPIKTGANYNFIVEEFYRPWLKITLNILSVIDGWATQTVLPEKGKTCHLNAYYVMYMSETNTWRYISLRDPKQNSAVRFGFWHTQKISRQYLNPRISAKQLKFVLSGERAGVIEHFCFRLEIYGSTMYEAQKGKLQLKEKFVSKSIRSKLTKNSYKLTLINVPKNLIRKSIMLRCAPEEGAMYYLANEVKWYEIIFLSKVRLESTKFTISVTLEELFYKRVFRCVLIRQGKGEKMTLFTREFILLERSKELITPFVTSETSVEYRGGRLSLGDPAPFIIEGQNHYFVSLNLANLVHPYVIPSPYSYFCPSSFHFHSPYVGYKRYGREKSVKDPLQCYDTAIKDGARAMTIRGNPGSCYGGPILKSWFFTRDKKIESFKNYDSWTYDGWKQCEEIFSHYKREEGAKCVRSCRKMRYWYSRHWPGPNKQYLHRLHFMSNYVELEINVKADGKKVFSKKYTITKKLMPGGPTKSKVPIYSSSLFPLSPYSLEEKETSGIMYNNCEGSAKEENLMKSGGCSSYVSLYGSEPWGTGSFLTFIYAFRNQYRSPPSRIHIYGKYKHEEGYDKKFSQYVDLQSQFAPVVELDSHIGVCYGLYKEVVPKIHAHDQSYMNWNFSWQKVTKKETEVSSEEKKPVVSKEWKTELLYVRREKLVLIEAHVKHSGIYELTVTSLFGTVSVRTHITVHKDYPRITWVTRSPHTVIADKSDILEVRTNTNKHIKAVEWYRNKIRIEASNHFTFLDGGSRARPEERKRLLLRNLDDKSLSGTYEVRLIGDFCSFTRYIRVSISIKPVVSITPETGYKNFLERSEGDKVVLTAGVLGGVPSVKEKDLYWKKDGYWLRHNPDGGTIIQKVKISSKKWVSTLTITPLQPNHEGSYSFYASSGKATSRATKVLYVLKGSKARPGKAKPAKSYLRALFGSSGSCIYSDFDVIITTCFVWLACMIMIN